MHKLTTRLENRFWGVPMLRDRRFSKIAFALVAAAAVAVVASGCAYPIPNSLTAVQPGGVGSVRVHFQLCSAGATQICGPNEDEEEEPIQYLLGIAVPPGSTPPQTITATPANGGAPIVFTRNEEVAPEIAAASAVSQKSFEEITVPPSENPALFEELKGLLGHAWPPNGLQGVGYISAPSTEPEGQNTDFSLDADFGLPGGSTVYAGPFEAALAMGYRIVDSEAPAGRGVHCLRFTEETHIGPEIKNESFCSGTLQQAKVGTANLEIATPKKTVKAFVGGTAKVGFPLTYAGTATTAPTFTLGGTTTVKGAKVAGGTFTPGTPDPTTHLSPAATGTATVALPKNVKPGTYQVTLTATTAQGGSVAQTAKLKVVKPTIKFGAAKLNTGKGTATLKVKVPGAGKLTIAGKGVKQVKKKAKKAATLKVKIAATGKAAAALQKEGKAKLKLKGTFKPSSGISVSKSKGITLKLK